MNKNTLENEKQYLCEVQKEIERLKVENNKKYKLNLATIENFKKYFAKIITK